MSQRTRTDWVLFSSILALMVFGLVMVYSATAPTKGWTYVQHQMAAAGVGLAGLMAFKRLDYRRLNTPAWARIPLAAVVVALVAVYFFDSKTHRFLRIGISGIQPSEFAKPALILFVAYLLTRRAGSINSRYTLGEALLVILPVSALVVAGDLGTGIVLVATATAMFYVAGLKRRYLVIALAAAAVLGACAVVVKPYRLARVVSVFDPKYERIEKVPGGPKLKAYILQAAYARDASYHVRQSKIAVGSGGITWLGLMQGRQKFAYLPEAHTDFIYAVVGEEFGLIGSLGVLAAFLLILWRGLLLFQNAPDLFGKNVALAITIMVIVQTLVNMSVVLGLGPTKGFPLPLVSYGGSSLVSSLLSLGLLLSVSEQSG